eukprot:COSAG02_NODE_32365_length_517_cov_1.229665_1_plen_132_part_00
MEVWYVLTVLALLAGTQVSRKLHRAFRVHIRRSHPGVHSLPVLRRFSCRDCRRHDRSGDCRAYRIRVYYQVRLHRYGRILVCRAAVTHRVRVRRLVFQRVLPHSLDPSAFPTFRIIVLLVCAIGDEYRVRS